MECLPAFELLLHGHAVGRRHISIDRKHLPFDPFGIRLLCQEGRLIGSKEQGQVVDHAVSRRERERPEELLYDKPSFFPIIESETLPPVGETVAFDNRDQRPFATVSLTLPHSP